MTSKCAVSSAGLDPEWRENCHKGELYSAFLLLCFHLVTEIMSWNPTLLFPECAKHISPLPPAPRAFLLIGALSPAYEMAHTISPISLALSLCLGPLGLHRADLQASLHQAPLFHGRQEQEGPGRVAQDGTASLPHP